LIFLKKKKITNLGKTLATYKNHKQHKKKTPNKPGTVIFNDSLVERRCEPTANQNSAGGRHR
jgi:hypothetical protein